MDTDDLLRDFASRARQKLKKSAKRFKKGKPSGTIRAKTVRVNGKTFGANEAVLAESIRAKTHRLRGSATIDRVGIQFAYHGVFVERGQGRGRRTPNPWVNPILEPEIAHLADQVSKDWADYSVKGVGL